MANNHRNFSILYDLENIFCFLCSNNFHLKIKKNFILFTKYIYFSLLSLINFLYVFLNNKQTFIEKKKNNKPLVCELSIISLNLKSNIIGSFMLKLFSIVAVISFKLADLSFKSNNI